MAPLSVRAIRLLNLAAAGWTAAWFALAAVVAVEAHPFGRLLSVLLGVAVGLIPTAPLLALWLPLQLAWRRDRLAVARAVRLWDGEPELDEFLAERALMHLSYEELRTLADGRLDIFEARGRLREAELHRLGLDR